MGNRKYWTGRAVARLKPVAPGLPPGVESRLAGPERMGWMRLGSGELVSRIVYEAAPRPQKYASAVARIIEDRDMGR